MSLTQTTTRPTDAQLLRRLLSTPPAHTGAPVRCANCGAAHHIQRCPEVLSLLSAERSSAERKA